MVGAGRIERPLVLCAGFTVQRGTYAQRPQTHPWHSVKVSNPAQRSLEPRLFPRTRSLKWQKVEESNPYRLITSSNGFQDRLTSIGRHLLKLAEGTRIELEAQALNLFSKQLLAPASVTL